MNPLDVLEAKNALAGIAEILAAYRDELVSRGFSEMEALTIVVAYQASLLAPRPRSGD